MSNYTKVGAAAAPRIELHDTLQLTGAAIGQSAIPAARTNTVLSSLGQ